MNVNRPGVGGRVRARRAADRRLVDLDHLVDELDALDAVVGARLVAGPVQRARQRAVQDVVDERGLARPAHAGDGGQQAQRDAHVEVLEVVRPRAADDEFAPQRTAPDRRARRSARSPRRYWPVSDSRSWRSRSSRRALEDHAAAVLAGARGRGRSRSRPIGSSPRRARRRSRCCRGRAAASASSAAAGCRAGAGRSTARRARRARRAGSRRSAWPAGCAGPRRPTASPRCGRASGSPTPDVHQEPQPLDDLAADAAGDQLLALA